MRPGIGDTLRAARRAQGRTLSDAAEATRVRETYLAALEEGDFAALGGDVYARGFLRSYARYLELDPEPLVQAYRVQRWELEHRGRGRPARRRGSSAQGSRRSQGAGSHEPGPIHRPDGLSDGARAPQERPAGAAILLLLVVVVLLVVAFAGLRDGRGGAAGPPTDAGTVEVVAARGVQAGVAGAAR